SRHSTSAMSAIPIGAPGWPELACCTPSMLRARIAFANTLRSIISSSYSIQVGHKRVRAAQVLLSEIVAGLQTRFDHGFQLTLVDREVTDPFCQLLNRHRILVVIPQELRVG